MPSIERVRIFLWLLFFDKQNTNVMRVKKNLGDNALCPRCLSMDETSIHFFRDCVFARDVWNCWGGVGLYISNFFSLNLRDFLMENLRCSTEICDLVTWSAQFAMTLWLICKSRNDLIFQQQVDQPSRVWFMARKLAREIGLILSPKSAGVPRSKLVKWVPPMAGMYLLNTDGAFKASSVSASAGGLIRGPGREWLAGFIVYIGTTDSLVAELWGLREGLLLATQRRLWPLVVELDASMVVHMVKNGVPHSHPCSVLVADVMALIAEGWTSEVRHIFIKGNKCADYLANLAQTTALGTTLLDEPPTGLVPLLDQDISGPTSVRI